MTKDLPAAPLPDDIIDRIAKEVAAQVRAHIERMYPAAAAAVAWGSAARSIQGVVRNTMSAAGRAAEGGTIEMWLQETARQRVSLERRTKRARREMEGW